MAESETPARTYEVEQLDGTVERLLIPEDWKITFGPILGSPSAGNEQAQRGTRFRNGYAFRAWESDNKQRILITGVVGFRDLSVPKQVKCVRRFGSESWFPDNGTWIGKKAEQVEKAWRSSEDPNLVDEDPEAASVVTYGNIGKDDEDIVFPRAKTAPTLRAR